MAIDSGMLIDHVGDLPGLGEEERLASELHELITNMGGSNLHDGWGMTGQSHWTLHTESGALLLATSLRCTTKQRHSTSARMQRYPARS